MRDRLGSNTVLGYCTNVHAGADYEQTLANLTQYTLPVKRAVSPDAPLGVGLWLSAQTARDLLEQDRVAAFKEWLDTQGLLAFTLNGFPFGDFHKEIVKLDVYLPQWDDPARLAYTNDLARILVALLGDQTEGSISTLPIAWRAAVSQQPEKLERAADHLIAAAQNLARIEAETGKYIHIDIEPEPGCCLDTAYDVVQLFKNRLLPRGDETIVRRHLRVCHDVCHAAVMFEDQADVLEQYASAGIAVGKVQISSAVRTKLLGLEPPAREEALDQLAAFDEKRYLHQTMVRQPGVIAPTFFADLPLALDAVRAMPHEHKDYPSELRTHFHVPLFVETFGRLESTQDEVEQCLQHLMQSGNCRHFEVETYAWNVLPDELQSGDLSEGIARELQWVIDFAAAETAK